MKKEDKTVIREMVKHKNLETNIPAYGGAYINAVYEYSLIRLVLGYYTMKEVEQDTGQVSADAFLAQAMERIHTLLFQTILGKDSVEDDKAALEEIHSVREELTEKMTVLTAYTDTLQIYEYVLNRIEYRITGEKIDVDETELAAKVFGYLFNDRDKMVVNSKIQMVTGQLPIRMTKNRFFDYLTDTLNIYKGSDKSSVDGFVDMLQSAALLELPKGYGTDYPEIIKVIRLLEDMDLKNMDLVAYQALMEQFSVTTTRLTELVSNYLLAVELVNNLYAAMLAGPYQKNEERETQICISMLEGLHSAFITNGEIPEFVDEGFVEIEGVQELLGEDIMQFESILPDVISDNKDTISRLMSDEMFERLLRISKLLSGSLFVNLEGDERGKEESADTEYITAKRDLLVGQLTEFFDTHAKEVNRAVMAALFSHMPVLFNSQQEIKEYIEYSLGHCGNPSELMACAKLLEEMMAEEC
ncbi:MAG: hypothetical protein K2K56_01240 [Lachnospiraceae bacterium]|nr:hypothetical protein [Lachnospiraceae bacterium]